MNKNYKVIKINGFRGLLTAVFVLGCALTGFVVFPAWMCMQLWNAMAENIYALPSMSLVHGILLWGIIGLSLYAINNSRSLIGFASHQALSEEQIKDIMERVKKNATGTSVHTNPLLAEKKESEENCSDSLDEIRK